jgi:hypothetical protein
MEQFGGCLCGKTRFSVSEAPLWVTVCFCRFCQKATGSDHMVEPIFRTNVFHMLKGAPRRYVHRSEGSGENIHMHFCADCGSKLCLTFDRWPDRLGVYAGAFDSPGWFQRDRDNTKYIFTGEAPRGAMLPAGYPAYREHAALLDGTALEPEILSAHKELRG